MEDQPGPILAIDELVLRPWRATDAAALMAACQDPEIGALGRPPAAIPAS